MWKNISGINRFLLVTLLGFLMVLIILVVVGWTFRDVIYKSIDSIFLSFYASLAEDFIFFGLVGGGIAVAQFYGHHGDILPVRVRKVFANKKASEKVLDYLTREISINAIYNVEAKHRMEIVDYSSENYAYRVEFRNEYLLRNLFGDMEYEADNLRTEIAPDLEKDSIDILGKFYYARIESGGSVESFGTENTSIPKSGYVVPITSLRLRKAGSARFTLAWWSWVSNLGNSGFSAKRFSEKFEIVIENKSLLHARIIEPKGDGQPGEPVVIAPGSHHIISTGGPVDPGVRVEFWWLPPVGEDGEELKADPQARGSGWHPILETKRSYGQPEERDF